MLVPPHFVQKEINELQMVVDAGSERFTQCENLARELVMGKNRFSTEILYRQEQLR